MRIWKNMEHQGAKLEATHVFHVATEVHVFLGDPQPESAAQSAGSQFCGQRLFLATWSGTGASGMGMLDVFPKPRTSSLRGVMVWYRCPASSSRLSFKKLQAWFRLISMPSYHQLQMIGQPMNGDLEILFDTLRGVHGRRIFVSFGPWEHFFFEGSEGKLEFQEQVHLYGHLFVYVINVIYLIKHIYIIYHYLYLVAYYIYTMFAFGPWTFGGMCCWYYQHHCPMVQAKCDAQEPHCLDLMKETAAFTKKQFALKWAKQWSGKDMCQRGAKHHPR